MAKSLGFLPFFYVSKYKIFKKFVILFVILFPNIYMRLEGFMNAKSLGEIVMGSAFAALQNVLQDISAETKENSKV